MPHVKYNINRGTKAVFMKFTLLGNNSKMESFLHQENNKIKHETSSF